VSPKMCDWQQFILHEASTSLLSFASLGDEIIQQKYVSWFCYWKWYTL